MKRLLFVSVLLMVGMGVLSAAPVATFLKVSNDVQLMGENDLVFRSDISVGTTISPFDQIKTGPGSFAALVFTDDKSIVKIRENTTLEVRDDGTIRNIILTEGKAQFDIAQQKGKTFRVQTPVSVASVKGTQFWVLTGNGLDKVFTSDGLVEVYNPMTNQVMDVAPGQVCIMTQTGQMMVIPFSENELPDASMFEEQAPAPAPEAPQGEEPGAEGESGTGEETGMESDSGSTGVVSPADVTIPTAAEGEIPAEAPAEEEKSGEGLGMGIGVGSATIDGKLYNQVALRPTFNVGKLGVGLDMVLYIDNEGNIRKDDWNNLGAVIDKIYFLSWGKKNDDPFYIRVGGLENVSLGNGIAVAGYTNMLEYPDVKRMGTEFSLQTEKLGLEGFIADGKELGGESATPGLVGARGVYKMKLILPINIGISGVADLNPYNAFDKDRDEDGYSDLMDFYPDYADIVNYDYLDADFDALLDPIAGIDNSLLQAIINSSTRFTGIDDNAAKDTLKVKSLVDLMDKAPQIYSIGADVSIPIMKTKLLGLNIYSEGSALGYHYYDWNTEKWDNSMALGTAPVGLSAQIVKFINARVEYRWAQENFVYSFFDRNYDIGRVGTQTINVGDTARYIVPKTRYDYMMDLNLGAVQGVYGSLSADLFSLATIQAAYMNMVSGTDNLQTFQATAGIQKGLVPKVSEAMAYYQRNNDENPFDFKNPSQNTLLGYRVGLEVSPGVSLVWNFMQTYRDKNGDGMIDPKLESLKVMSIETGFNF